MNSGVPDTTPSKPANDGFTSGGDLTLRSSDSVDFSVHSVILSLVSPVFSDMFTVGTRTEPDVVTVGETSEVLSLMLNFIYHRGPLSVTTFPLLNLALCVAEKYQLETLTLQLRDKMSLKGSPVSIDTNPLVALTVASAHSLKQEASLAASAASKKYNFEKVDDLLILAKAIPSSFLVIQLVGIPSARNAILVEVLFRFHLAPMVSSYLLCQLCKAKRKPSSEFSPPEWKFRWAHWVYEELKTRPPSQVQMYWLH
jgi:hypothetical protein